MKRGLFLGLLCLFCFSGTLRAEDISLEQVVLRGLDKVTGRLSTMTVNVGEKTTFGALDIYVRVCYVHPPEETPENAAYLDIVENKEEGQLKLFSGWMFSSSPALSAMEHAVYDVWVLKCQGEPVAPPVPKPLVLENPIELAPVQPKLKIILEEKKESVSVEQQSADEPEQEETLPNEEQAEEASKPEDENTAVQTEQQEKPEETDPNISVNEDVLEDEAE
ncbi:MAG: DUF2155 domain-containing protein [Alphaproteobacteria bacterium]|nr:DUF2155 domain-containing protein [Alphaproteobacteria bacterium]